MRFNEFRDEYVILPLKDCLKIKSGRDQKGVECNNGKYKIYGTGGVIGFTNTYLFDKESVGIGRKGTINKPFYFNEPFWTVDTLFYSEIKQNYVPKYIYYLFQTIPWKKYNTSTGVPSLTSSSIEAILKGFPLKEEQYKIANFLSLIDQRIETQIKIISDKISLKNQLSNDFFTSCHDYLKLDEFIKYGKAGGTPKSTNKDYYNGKIPFLSISDITEQGKYITRTSKTISKLGIKNSSSWIVPENSLILSMYASVGLPTINKISLATSQAMYSMILKDSDNLEFLYYYLCYFQKYKLNSYLETGTQSNINANTVKSISIPNINKIERIKIANIMTKIDYSISFEKEILDNYQLQKCYLLKNMFI